MTTHFARGTTRLPISNSQLKFVQLLSAFAVLLMMLSAAIAQPATGTVKTLTLKSAVLGEDRVVLVRTPVGYETNKVSYPVLYMTDGDAHITHTSSTIEFLTQRRKEAQKAQTLR